MDKLSLPSFDINIKEYDGKMAIFDIIRKKYVSLTPEEWVRQHFIHFLINHMNYAKGLISVEQGVKYNALQKRTDIVVYTRTLEPQVVVECKAPTVNLNRKVMEQAIMYNHTIQAPYIILTNGMEHSCMYINKAEKRVDFLSEIPTYANLNQ